MKKLTALALAAIVAANMATAEAHLPTPPVTLPENAGYCLGGGAVAALAATGIGAGPALIAVALCAIIVTDLRWHAEGNSHGD